MEQTNSYAMYQQLDDRRIALQRAISEVGTATDLVRLLAEVDQAIARLENGDFGKCVVCDEYMTDDEMHENPLRRYCLCELSHAQQAALQIDLDMAWQVQSSLLPAQDLTYAGWQTHYRYFPAGPISGDYCELLPHAADGGWLYFLVGDVSGKGIAAAYLMAHMSALVRRTLDEAVSVPSLIDVVNRHLKDRSSDSHFVTLVAGRAHRSGRVEMGNAGHCRPIVLRRGGSFAVNSSGLPVGVLDRSDYPVSVLELDAGDSVILYSDGISESTDVSANQFGAEALRQTAFIHRRLSPALLAAACLDQVGLFRAPAVPHDDMTLMVLRRE